MAQKVLKVLKELKNIFVKYCDYSASQKCHYDKHLASKKHKKMCHENVTKLSRNVTKKV